MTVPPHLPPEEQSPPNLVDPQSAAAVTEPVQAATGWHQDADCLFGPELNFLEVFYFPQDTPAEAGPT